MTSYSSINALAESFNGLYKWELIYRRGPWRGLDDLEIATCRWVSWFYDERIHGELDDLTPAEVEAAYHHRTQPEAA